MWNEIYVEDKIKDLPRVKSILEKTKINPIFIERYSDLWGRSKKPYLHKRDSLNLFLARKEGQLIKEAPDAYGTSGELHFYFIHAYNCIYECQYCYLQGYFNTPDIVLFVNHEEIIQEMQNLVDLNQGKKIWFHAGEFSDSLALSHLTNELSLYHEFCLKNPNAIIELRTKSVNIKELENLIPIKNLIASFSLSPLKMGTRVDLKTPNVISRIKVMRKLLEQGWPIGMHFDPIIYEDQFKESYKDLLEKLKEENLTDRLEYLSLGVVRFTKDVYREVEKNYPNSVILTGPMVKSFDGKVRYHRPMRMWMMNTIKDLCIKSGIKEEKIYLCMEDDA